MEAELVEKVAFLSLGRGVWRHPVHRWRREFDSCLPGSLHVIEYKHNCHVSVFVWVLFLVLSNASLSKTALRFTATLHLTLYSNL